MDATPMMVPATAIAWPQGCHAAAAFSFDVDAESVVLGSAPEFADRLGVMSHQAYGPLTGVPRILDVLDRCRVRATFFVPGYTAHRHPQMLRAVVAAGHEIGHHGYLHESLVGVDEQLEASYLDRGLAALEEVAGVVPVGYRAPNWEPTYVTHRLLAERGFRYDSSLMDADTPYELAVPAGPGGSAGARLVEIPVQWALDDWEAYCFIPDFSGSGAMEHPDQLYARWFAEYEAMVETGGCFVLTCHPFLTGRPSRAAALERLIAHAVADPRTWVASLEEIAAHVEAQGLEPRSLPKPSIEPG
jgi:peptidoglycan/xylan/chitin deacetylase (PgdA/CDA1 family)